MTDTTQPAGAPWGRRLARVVGSVLGWAVIAVVAWFLWPSSLGGNTTAIIVSGKSMEPTYLTGDIVIARAGDPVPGDIVVYQTENLGDAKIIHRIIGGNGTDGWIIQGDNNDFVDPFRPTNEDVLGIAKVHLPGVGLVASILQSPLVWGGFLLLAMALILWPSKDCDDDEDEDSGDDEDRAYADPDLAEEYRDEIDEIDVSDPDDQPATVPAAQFSTHPAAASAAGASAASASAAVAAPRWSPRRRNVVRGMAFSTLMAAMFAFVVPAQAAQLTVNANGISVAGEARCTTATLPTTTLIPGAGRTVLRVNSVPASCVGQPISVHILNTAGQIIASGTGTTVAGQNGITVSPAFNTANVARTVVFIGTWWMNTTWTVPVPPPAFSGCVGYNYSDQLVTCSVTTAPDYQGTSANGRFGYFNINVFQTSNGGSLKSWTVNVSLTSMSWLTWTPQWFGKTSGTAYVSACNMPQVTLHSGTNSGWGGRFLVGEFGPEPGFNGTPLCTP